MIFKYDKAWKVYDFKDFCQLDSRISVKARETWTWVLMDLEKLEHERR